MMLQQKSRKKGRRLEAAMLEVEVLVWLVIALLLRATPAVADVARDLARCELEAERLYPAPDNKGLELVRTGSQPTETGR